MNEQEIFSQIEINTTISPGDIAIAKTFILKNFRENPSDLLNEFLGSINAEKLDKFVIHASVDTAPQIEKVTTWIKWRIAFVEALWGLINSGYIIPFTQSITEVSANQSWTTVVSGSGGQSGGWSFEKFKYPIPSRIKLVPSISIQKASPLADADLYLADMDIPLLHEEIEDALRQAVLCFKGGLFLPALAMLGMAVEGGWIELGKALLEANIEHPQLTAEFKDRRLEELQSPYLSFLKKMERVEDLYRKQDIYKPISKESGYSHTSLAQVMSWSNVIRDSRNAIHFSTEAASSNTYDKVAALLLGVNQNFRIIYSIIKVAQEHPG